MRLAAGTAKYLLFFFNFIFFITGIAIIAVAAVAKHQQKDIEDNLSVEVSTIPIFLIVVGSFVTIISFFGCCGAIRNSYCMLISFSVLLSFIFICEFAAGIAAYAKQDDLVKAVHDAFEDLIHKYKESNESRADLDSLQQHYKCCGDHNATDWNSTYWNPNHLPYSCCDHDHVKIETDCNMTTAFEEGKKGCYEAFTESITKNIDKIGAAGLTIAFIQIVGVVLACCLASAVKDQV